MRLVDKMYINAKCGMSIMKNRLVDAKNRFLYDEEGALNVVEIVVLIAIVIILAVAFRKQIVAILTTLFGTISTGADSAAGGEESFGG